MGHGLPAVCRRFTIHDRRHGALSCRCQLCLKSLDLVELHAQTIKPTFIPLTLRHGSRAPTRSSCTSAPRYPAVVAFVHTSVPRSLCRPYSSLLTSDPGLCLSLWLLTSPKLNRPFVIPQHRDHHHEATTSSLLHAVCVRVLFLVCVSSPKWPDMT